MELKKMSAKPQKKFQVLVQSHDLPISTRALTVTPDLTLRHLKLSLLPANQTLDPSSFFFTFDGKPLLDSSALRDSRVTPFSTLTLRSRLPGGGGDGGATGAESRDCYLNMYAVKKPDKVDPNEQRLSKWLNCALSNEPLKHPVVVDFLGNLFNKEALVEGLLEKKLPKAFGHVKGLKDMLPIKLSVIPGMDSDLCGAIDRTKFQCPITGLEFNGKYKFFALATCGHVLSAKALKEVKSSTCLVCHKEFNESNKIVINGNEEEVANLREKMETEKANVRNKKMRKVKNGESGMNREVGVCKEPDLSVGTKHTIHHGVDKMKEGLGKIEGNGKVDHGGAKRFKAGDMAPPNANKEVYASIFTSSRKSDFKETYSCRSLPLGRN